MGHDNDSDSANPAASTGEIQQLQIVNQQLALIHTELANLVQNLATFGRVVTGYVAASTAIRRCPVSADVVAPRIRRTAAARTDPDPASLDQRASASFTPMDRLQELRAQPAASRHEPTLGRIGVAFD